MKQGEVDSAERRALNLFDNWNDVTECVPKHSGYYYEMQAVITDAVHCGIQQALKDFKPLDSEEQVKDSIMEGGVHGKVKLVEPLYVNGEVYVSSNEVGIVTAYLPEDKTFAVFFGKERWITFEETEEDFNNRVKWIEKGE